MLKIDYKTITIRFTEKFANYFDTIFNCQIKNRVSDQWLIERDRPMLAPRDGTSRLWNEIIKDWSSSTAYVIGDYVILDDVTYKCNANHTNQTPPNASYWDVVTSPGQSNGFFYTDRTWTRRHYRVFDENLQYLNGSTWTNIKTLTSNDVEFSIQRVPLNTSWADSTSRTTSWNATTTERVKRDAWDALNANNNIWTILLITSWIYKWCYAPIIAYDTWTTEYILGWAGIITALPVWITYKRYDTVWDVLQVARWYSSENELYFDGITEMTWLQWFTTDSLINIAAITSGNGVKKMVSFNNYVWTFAWSTLFYTGWYPWNPLFFNYTWALTLWGNGNIVDIFQYKSRLVVIGTNFIFSVNTNLSVDRHVTSFGWIRGAYINTWDDVYIFTTQKTLVSMNETINGVVWLTNAGQDIDNYLETYNTNIAFWFDSQKLYLYWEPDANTEWTMCVFDIKRKMWIFYTWIRAKSFISENGVMYINDNNSDIYRYFDEDATTDVSVWTSQTTAIAQSFTLKEIDLSDIFTMKIVSELYFSFENFTQSIAVNTYMAINEVNGQKIRSILSVEEVPLGTWTLGTWTIAENTFWSAWMLDIISVPLMKKVGYAKDAANLFKIAVSWYDGSTFYLNQLDIIIWFAQEQKVYFDATNSY